ncbi:hypothetical protein L1049_002963 [Liquidambar formosana]|uniref:FLZ-type domain-containing protein n=1 Tax=Liquidambar formosana TaxID=63359 RepID=A0AAP0NLA1_LIQFO
MPEKKMMLGKRPRPPIKRTTSMTGITVDLSNVEAQEPSEHHRTTNVPYITKGAQGAESGQNNMSGFETAHFLRTCGLCNRRLAPGRDIYMYRGDTAFCSLECREQLMKQEEGKAKCSVASSMKGERHAASSTATSKASSKSETVAAA